MPWSPAATGAATRSSSPRRASGALLMPDLRGRSVRDAARICAQLGLIPSALGGAAP